MTHSTPNEGNWADAHRDSRRRKHLKQWLLCLFVAGLSITVTPATTSTLPWRVPGTMTQRQHGSTTDVHEATHLFQPSVVSAPGVVMDEQGNAAAVSSLATRRVERTRHGVKTESTPTPVTPMRQDIPPSIASTPARGETRRLAQTAGSAFGSGSNVDPSLRIPFNPVASSTPSATQHGGIDAPTPFLSGTSGLLPEPSSSGGTDAMISANPVLGHARTLRLPSLRFPLP